jgi:hypothetical protein
MFLYALHIGHDAVMYFDPDIEIFGRLDNALAAINEGASFVLTPHLLEPAEGSRYPDDVDIMLAGIYNLGFLGVGATSEAHDILEWWARRLRYQCVNQQTAGLFVDQKFFDLVPGFSSRACILRDAAYNVAYWNLSSRNLALIEGSWYIEDQPLIFFHFSGFDPINLNILSKHSQAFRGEQMSSTLRAIINQYADQLITNNYNKIRKIPYAYGKLTSGVQISDQMRRAYREGIQDILLDPFSDFDMEPFLVDDIRSRMMNAEVQAMLESTSWRITRPLRAISRRLRGH